MRTPSSTTKKIYLFKPAGHLTGTTATTMAELPDSKELQQMSDDLHDRIDTNGDLTEYEQGLLDAVMWFNGGGDKPSLD